MAKVKHFIRILVSVALCYMTLWYCFQPVNGEATTAWIKKAHNACFAGNSHFKTKKGWKIECVKSSTAQRYIVSGLTTSKLGSKINFGPSGPSGHPKWINYQTSQKDEALSLMYHDGRKIMIESTDFKVEFWIEILTPDSASPNCYHLEKGSEKGPKIKMIRSNSCPM